MSRPYLLTGAILIILAIALVVLGSKYRDGSITNRDQTTEYKTYSNEELGFELERPGNSSVSREGENRVKFTVLGDLNSPNTEITDGLTLTVTANLNVVYNSLEDYVDARVESNSSNGGLILTSPEATVVGGMRAIKYSFQNLLGRTSWEYVFLPQPGRGYVVTYSVIDPENIGYEEIALKMLNSLTFK